MKKLSLLLIVTLILSITLTTAMAADNVKPEGKLMYQLNIIGVDNPKTTDMTETSRNTIFVDLYGESDILLEEGDFSVIDGNATGVDGEAIFSLPRPGVDAYIDGLPYYWDEVLEEWVKVDTITDYSVYARALGTPGDEGEIFTNITTRADIIEANIDAFMDRDAIKALKTDALYGYTFVLQPQTITLGRIKGKPKLINVTEELLTLRFAIYENDEFGEPTGDPIGFVIIPLFDDILEGECWNYDNNGLKLLQLRFYSGGTDLEPDAEPPTE